jgi:hypothetical protein
MLEKVLPRKKDIAIYTSHMAMPHYGHQGKWEKEKKKNQFLSVVKSCACRELSPQE